VGEVLRDFSFVLVFALLALILGLVVFFIPYLIAPRVYGDKTESLYECGIDPYGSAWIRYSVLFYLYALMFVGFEVDVLYLFPVGVSYLKEGSVKEFLILLIFLAFLLLPLLYAYRKGVFKWKFEVRG
jgi:NADH-quinone oxidoreductase subunit A